MRSVPQDAAVQLVQRSVEKVTLMIEKDAEQLFKNSEFYSLVRMKKKNAIKIILFSVTNFMTFISERFRRG